MRRKLDKKRTRQENMTASKTPRTQSSEDEEWRCPICGEPLATVGRGRCGSNARNVTSGPATNARCFLSVFFVFFGADSFDFVSPMYVALQFLHVMESSDSRLKKIADSNRNVIGRKG